MAPRRGAKRLLLTLIPRSSGTPPEPAEQDVERGQRPRARQIVRAFDPFDAAVGARHQRVILVAKAEIERQPRVDLPPIAHVDHAFCHSRVVISSF